MTARDDFIADVIAEDAISLLKDGKGASPRKLAELRAKWRQDGANRQTLKVAELLTSVYSGLHESLTARCQGIERGIKLSQHTFLPQAVSPSPSAVVNLEFNRVRDQYQAGQAGAMGPHSVAQHNTFQQIWDQSSGSIDLTKLAQELGQLRTELRPLNANGEHDEEMGALKAAESAAKQNDGPKALEQLKAAGHWALDTATKIGVAVASEAIKMSMH